MNVKRVMAWILVCAAQATYARGIPDPTRPPWLGAPAGVVAPAKPGLRAILLGGPRRLALIDGQLLGVGGRVGRDHIVAIHHNMVILVGRGGLRRLFLETRSPNIKKATILREGSQ